MSRLVKTPPTPSSLFRAPGTETLQRCGTRDRVVGHSARAMWTRRQLLQSGLASFAAIVASPALAKRPRGLRFEPVPTSTADAVAVPSGYRAEVLLGWGDPVGIIGHTTALDRKRPTVALQATTAGMGHDGLELFPVERGGRMGKRLLVGLNHEFAELSTLFPDRKPGPMTAEEVALAMLAQGISIFEIHDQQGKWRVAPSRLARRITGLTPMLLTGPAAGSPWLVTPADPLGRKVIGTFANCGTGLTPWGTLLSGEENVDDYFRVPEPDARAARYGLRSAGTYRFFEGERRFDAGLFPNEPNRFGWVVEVDPYDASSVPTKRTALGRLKHESATARLDPDGTLAIYMGDDEAFEFLYKFVPSRRFDPTNEGANRDLLDEGTLYVGRFDADGTGRWLPLVHDSIQAKSPLGRDTGFSDQAEVLIFARLAGTVLGATPLDRPEWVAVHPETKEGYAALTNNHARGLPGQPGVDAANPREANAMGQILRWHDQTARSTSFTWDLFVLAGASPTSGSGEPLSADAFACPDAIRFGPSGHLWIGTDAPTPTLMLAGMGHNQLVCADPSTGELRRFLTAPKGAEVTGLGPTPDGKTLLVAIQHPSDQWPDGPDQPPRSALMVVTRRDGQALV